MRKVHTPPDPRGLAVGWLVGAHMDHALAKALPDMTIVMTDKGPAEPSVIVSDLARARDLAGIQSHKMPLYLIGYSAGCQAVRHLVSMWPEPDRVVDMTSCPNMAVLRGVACFDGTHSSHPPSKVHVDLWREIMGAARRRELSAIFTCTSMDYTEKLARPYASTRAVLSAAFDSDIPIDGWAEGDLYVRRYPSKTIDKDAHIHQQREVMPELLAMRWGPSSTEGPSILADARAAIGRAVDIVGSWFDYDEPPPKVRAVQWALEQVRQGIGESPPGSNDGPHIRKYFRNPGLMRDGKPIRISFGDWCAAGIAYAHHVTDPKHPWPAMHVSGIEYESDAIRSGTALTGPGRPPSVEVGDLVVFPRGPAGGWQRHIAMVASLTEGDSYTTVDGNAGARWAVRVRSWHDPYTCVVRVP